MRFGYIIPFGCLGKWPELLQVVQCYVWQDDEVDLDVYLVCLTLVKRCTHGRKFSFRGEGGHEYGYSHNFYVGISFRT